MSYVKTMKGSEGIRVSTKVRVGLASTEENLVVCLAICHDDVLIVIVSIAY